MSTSACGEAHVLSQGLYPATPVSWCTQIPRARATASWRYSQLRASSRAWGQVCCCPPSMEGGHSQTHSVIVHQCRVPIRVECRQVIRLVLEGSIISGPIAPVLLEAQIFFLDSKVLEMQPLLLFPRQGRKSAATWRLLCHSGVQQRPQGPGQNQAWWVIRQANPEPGAQIQTCTVLGQE